LDVVEAPGHTPGSSLVVLSDHEQRLMLLGDVIPCAVNLLESEWAALADVDQELAKRTRENVIREIEDGNALAAGGHFPGLQFGRILEGEGRKHVVFETPE
jgi:glyoxylase-like metal-dependent hydrolase (beta-lactamase superfamily II)